MIQEQHISKKDTLLPVLFRNKNECCGCSACYSICPVKAIEMKWDKDGFLYPFIDVSKCIHCLKCVSICSFKKNDYQSTITEQENNDNQLDIPLIYGGRLKDRRELMLSSSGGAFTALSDIFLNNGDAVACSLYNVLTHQQEFRIITSKAERDNARGSNYIQGILNNVFNDAEKWLCEHPQNKLMFVGTGCQADGFQTFAKKKGFFKRIVTIDIICHGAPSPQVWKDYAASLEHKHGKITSISFKDKRNGWLQPTSLVTVGDKEVSIQEYKNIFTGRYNYRPSCYICPYTKIQRGTDITIGDFWQINERRPECYSQEGTSLFIVHTQKGHQLFEKAKESIKWFESNTEECLQFSLEKPVTPSILQKCFWKDYHTKGIDYVIDKYGKKTVFSKLRLKVCRIFAQLRER